MRYLLALGVILGITIYLKVRFNNPGEVIGSELPDNEDRRRRLIRAEQDQDFDLGFREYWG